MKEKKRSRLRKLAAPIGISIFTGGWVAGWAVACWLLPVFGWVKVLAGGIALALIGVTVFVLKERIQEIRSGEEDDLSQY